MAEEKKKKKGLFRSISETAEKTGDTVQQVGKDLKDTADKVQEVLDDSNENVKTILKIALVALGVTAAASIFNMTMSMFGRHPKIKGEVPTIVIHNLYLGAPDNMIKK